MRAKPENIARARALEEKHARRRVINPYRLYTVQETSLILGVDMGWLYDEVKAGKFPATRVHREWRVCGWWIKDYMDALLTGVTQTIPFPGTAEAASRKGGTPWIHSLKEADMKRTGT